MKIYYNPKLKQRSRDLRNNSTLAEILIWNKLKSRQMRGYQFMRQKTIGNYIVDFYCSKLKLVVVIDGVSHLDKPDYDLKRQKDLETMGMFVMRFDHLFVKQNLQSVLQTIYDYIVEFEKS